MRLSEDSGGAQNALKSTDSLLKVGAQTLLGGRLGRQSEAESRVTLETNLSFTRSRPQIAESLTHPMSSKKPTDHDSRKLSDEELNTIVGGVSLYHWQGNMTLPKEQENPLKTPPGLFRSS